MNSDDTWDGKSINNYVASGIYYVVVEGNGWKKAQKIAVVREAD